MVSEDTLVNIIKEQTKVNQQIFDKLDQIHEDLERIHNDFNRVLDKYDVFGDKIKSVEIYMKVLVGLLGSLLITVLIGFATWVLAR